MHRYTGRVSGRGVPSVRELPALRITKLQVGSMGNNAYLLRCAATGEQVLVDAPADPRRILDTVGTSGLTAVVTTHRHRDHWQALTSVVRACGARSLAHAADAPEIPGVTATLADRETVRVGAIELEVIQLVGHTPGSIALLYDGGTAPSGSPHLFTGDALFPGGPGRTTCPEDFTRLMDDLETKIFGRLPDSTWFYPGHGDDSTLGAERAELPRWRARGW